MAAVERRRASVDANERPIRELPPRVAAQIAAGEVVERPASALKELLENALDAGAGRIEVEIAGAGRQLIAVRDDGVGIAAGQVELALRRHATSKLSRADELDGLRSYGFRGEALPAIAAAAGRMRLATRTRAETAAAVLEFERGRARPLRAGARAVGTTVEVEDLFLDQPARRAFLAGARSERAALVRAASDAALAHPERALRLVLDGRLPLEHEAARPGDSEGALREALASVFTREAAERSLWLDAERELADASGMLRLEGLAGAPADARRTRERIRLFVNGRPVHDRRLSFAVQEAYRDWLRPGEFPLVVARLELPPEAVDVNVHPSKMEVKLRHPDAAFSLLQRAIRAALDEGRRSAPLRLAPSGAGGGTLGPASQPGSHPASHEASAERHARPDELAVASLTPTPRLALPVARPRTLAVAEPALAPSLNPSRRAEFDRPSADGSAALTAPTAEYAPPAAAALPPLRMIGQLHRTFIIAEGPGGLVLVDQHGAHERVLYERLLAASASADGLGKARQPLLEPRVLALDAEQTAVWSAAAARLEALGFEADLFGERALRLRAVPAALAASDAEQLVRGVLADLETRSGDPQRFDRAAASAACHGSVRRGAVLDATAMSALLRDLERCQNPHSCPHGRPTLVEIAADDVLRQFRRK